MILAWLSTPAYGQGTIPPSCNNEGPRVQLLYVRTTDSPDAYEESLPAILGAAYGADRTFDISAHKTGGHRHIRYAKNPDCTLSVLHVLIPTGSEQQFITTLGAIQLAGHIRTDRKYLAFIDADAQSYCGLGYGVHDDVPGADNLNNRMSAHGFIYRRCWNWLIAAHELVHALGGVPVGAPHGDGKGHCTDGLELMCPYWIGKFEDMPCPIEHSALLDCNNDDYFNTSPEPGSYLAGHWNIADSVFLDAEEGKVYIPYVGGINHGEDGEEG